MLSATAEANSVVRMRVLLNELPFQRVLHVPTDDAASDNSPTPTEEWSVLSSPKSDLAAYGRTVNNISLAALVYQEAKGEG